ncbi:interferon alpha-inducible protein 27-like protein 2A [Oreochromis aureus]|uniref:interferon alpha-inducible protein 27-like protein 2A n=1 Tax=Oreochromis aureus TaxID=47969 RepID=UPI001953D3CF|nr:interferon alpha-inducible protein 27-like protein 2A [Oreochromis aureus]CAI5696924.1 unnamed protein product [Mustela putorius furo]
MDIGFEEICKAVLVFAVPGGVVILTPAILATLGFTSAGIVAGSIAARLMSLVAITGGGGIAAAVIATLQSWGASGLSWAVTLVFGSAGAAVAWVLSTVCNVTVIYEDSHSE